jgi:hypothetical protein
LDLSNNTVYLSLARALPRNDASADGSCKLTGYK